MILIDLSRDIEHKMAVLPNHPQVIVTAEIDQDHYGPSLLRLSGINRGTLDGGRGPVSPSRGR